MSSAAQTDVITVNQPEAQVQATSGVNFAYLDERTKRMIRRAILKAVAIPGYQVPFGSREMPLPYGWGTGGIQITAAVIGPDDTLKVIDQGSDDTVNAVNIRRFFQRTTGVGLLANYLSFVPWNLGRRSSFDVHNTLRKLRGELL